MKYTIITLLIIFNIGSIVAGGYSLSGTVYQSSGEPAEYVSVRIDSLGIQAYSDESGKFTLGPVREGKYHIEFSRIDCRKIDTLININAGSNELIIRLPSKQVQTCNVVVTGTRTEKSLENHPIPMALVSGEELASSASLRLNDILSEETGLTIVDDHGKGLQIQGLDADYALILVNGNPLIGREGGVIDIERLALGNVKRIEIVKGPASSLYGSSALAGVINIITDKPLESFSSGASARYASNKTIDLNANTVYRTDNNKWYIGVYGNRLSSEGYDAGDNQYGKIIPEYIDYTANADITYHFTHDTRADFNIRYNSEVSNNFYQVKETDSYFLVDDEARLNDLSFALKAKHRYNSRINIEAKYYGALYSTEIEDRFRESGEVYDQYTFDQALHRFELQSNYNPHEDHMLTAGGGLDIESVEAGRIAENSRTANLFYAFLQDDWYLADNINIIASTRYDSHSDYSSKFSPAFAASWNPIEELTFRVSVGSGFKAPSFQQLYLDWSNAVAGYNVFGVSNFENAFRKLQDEGQILEVYTGLDNPGTLKPESSVSYNFGLSFRPMDFISINANAFMHKLTDMIATQPVALKTNGQQVFTYFNLNSVTSRGIEANMNIDILDNLALKLGYQYLDTYDDEVLEQIRKEEIYKLGSTGIFRPVQEVEYGGLFNRSKHSGSVKLKYSIPDWGFSASLRTTYRSRYGLGDKNGNLILDDDSEYVPGYTITNLTLTQNINDNFKIQAGSDNLTDEYSAHFLSVTPGRTFFINIIFNYSKQ